MLLRLCLNLWFNLQIFIYITINFLQHKSLINDYDYTLALHVSIHYSKEFHFSHTFKASEFESLGCNCCGENDLAPAWCLQTPREKLLRSGLGSSVSAQTIVTISTKSERCNNKSQVSGLRNTMNLANIANYEDVYKIFSWFCCASDSCHLFNWIWTLAPLTTLLVVKECVWHLGYEHPGHPVLPSLDPRPL